MSRVSLFAIRAASRKDLPAIVDIFNQAVAARAAAQLEPVAVEDWRCWLSEHSEDRHPVLVAAEGEAVLGWLSLGPYRPGRSALRHTAEITYYVDYSHQRRGVASALVEAALERCPALGLRHLFAILLEDNAASVGLLEKFGFQRWGHMPQVARFGDREVGHLYYGRHVP